MSTKPAIIESHLQSIENETEIKPWARLEGEPTFWYNRYKRYQSLGPKRTMLAALQQERLLSKAPKSTQNGQKSKSKPKKSGGVPGSWKAASIRWNWIARALAYDEDKITQMVALEFEDLYNDVPMAFNRVLALRNIFTVIQKDFNTNHGLMSPDQKLGYYNRMSAILRDIKEEMRVFDAPTQALVLRHFAAKTYADYKPPTTPEGYLQLVEKAGGKASFSEQIAAEIARRKELVQVREAFAEEQ